MRKVAYTSDDDALLMKYIATYNPQIKGRLGIKLYERLVENEDQKWSFSSRHSVQSWRERYKNNQPWFDTQILKYQKKHGISVNAFDNSPSKSFVQSGVTKTLPVGNIPSGSTVPIDENGAKKRRREVEEEDTNLHPGVAKKKRQKTAPAQGSQPFDSPPGHPRTRSPSAELRDGEKVDAESSCHDEEESAPGIGPDDYTGALPSSGESEEGVGSKFKDRGVSASARVSRPSAPANDAEVKLSQALRRSASPRVVGATATNGEPSFSHQQHNISSGVAVNGVSELMRDSIGSPQQPSQEPTPPETSDINSPRILSVSQKQERVPPSRRKRTIVSRGEDDIFGTPPPQAVRASPQPRTRGRKAPRLVEGPFRSAYTNSNGQSLHVRSPSGTDEEGQEAGTNGADEEWPPRRGKRRSSIPSGGLNPTPSREVSGPAPVTNHNRLLFPAAPTHELPLPAPGSPSKRASLGQNQNPAALVDTPITDPFEVPLVNREVRRWTLASNSEIPQIDGRQGDLVRRASVHHIDLRALHLGKSVGTLAGRAISVGCSNTSKSSGATTKKWFPRPSRSSNPPNLSESNKKLVLSLGLEAVYSRMAENHKFHIDVVREVAAEQPSLEDTDRVLCNMRLAASREFARSLRQNEAADTPVGCETGESEEEDDDDDNSGDEEDHSQSVQPSHGPLSSDHSPASPVPRRRAMRLALKIPTASPDPSPTRPPDYSPPTPTRARAFRRLERQGRVEEARLREARRVRRSPRSSSAEASPEADRQIITSYLLQLRDDMDGVPLEKPRNLSGPGRLGKLDETKEDGRGVGRLIRPEPEEGYANADTRQSQGNEDADSTTEVEEQVNAGGDSQTLSDPQAVGQEVESHMGTTGVHYGVIAANARQSPPGNVLTEETGHYGFPLDKYAKKTTSSLASSAVVTLSVLDAEWTNSDDELLLDGDLTEHEGLVRRKGLCSVKFRTAHLYSLLLDG